MKNFVYVCFFINTIKVQSMRKMLFITLLMGGLCTTVSVAKAQERLPEYLQAEKYTQEKLNTMLFSTVVDPHWFQKGNNFWFEYKTSEGTFWYVVDPAARTKKLLFDRDELASQLTEIVKDPFEARHLPITNLKAEEDGRTFTFEVKSTKNVDNVKTDKPINRLVCFSFNTFSNHNTLLSNRCQVLYCSFPAKYRLNHFQS